MGAVLDGVPNDPAHPKRTRIGFDDGDGTFSIGEFGWLAEAENEKFKGHAKLAAGLWARGWLSAKWRDAQAVGGTATEHAEDALELSYRFSVTLWLAIQPNVQYVRNPGGTNGASNAKLIGVRLELAL